MDRDHMRLADGRTLTRGSKNVGPNHDPYGRVYVRMNNADGSIAWIITDCALAGLYLDLGGEEVFSRRIDDATVIPAIVEHTGYGWRFWLEKVWELRARARYRRMTPEEREYFEQMREMDARLLSYAM